MLDWIIVGGGVQGTHLSLVLTQRLGVPADRIRVVDPHPAPLACFERCTRRSGMRFLRSPLVHHIDLDPLSLHRFARSPAARPFADFLPPYRRPGLALFLAHARSVVARHRLHRVRRQAWVTGLAARRGSGLRVETSAGRLEANRVLLALGQGEQPCWPSWARALRRQGAAIEHVYEPGAIRPIGTIRERTVVVGGGLTAAQIALRLAADAPGRVTLLSPHPIRIAQFDSDPGWIGPRFLTGFRRERDPAARRRMITHARNPGTLTPGVAASLAEALREGSVTWRLGRAGDPVADFELARAGRIVLATGFSPGPPGSRWLASASRSLGLPRHRDQYPDPGPDLHWGKGVYVAGPLAELALGPVARNIAGARLAAQILMNTL